MSLLLAMDTSSRWGSLALLHDDTLLAAQELPAERRHDEQLLRAIEELLNAHGYRAADLTHVAFGEGPGSFTGVRLAASAAHGIGWALSIPVYGVNSLHALVGGIGRTHGEQLVAVAVDARMGQVYWWCGESATLREEARVYDHAALVALPLPTRPFIAVGDAWGGSVVAPMWRDGALAVITDAHAEARDIAALARRQIAAGARPAAGDAQPRYIQGADQWRPA